MSETFLFLFIGICAAIVAWSLIRVERVYQYPFFMTAIFLSFILPQAIALVNIRSFDPLVSEGALQRVLLYSCMCAGMCWLGYQFKPNTKWLDKLDIAIDERKLFISGFLLLTIGSVCYFSLFVIDIEIAANGTWTGIATILVFFANLLSIAFPIFLVKSLTKLSLINTTLASLSALPILIAILIFGRRQPTVTFLIIIGLSFFIVKRFILPRWLLVLSVALACFIIPVLGNLRGGFWDLLFSGDWQSILSSSQQGLEQVTEGKILELRNAALMIDYSERLNKFGYGAGFWDSLVWQFVPGQIVGFGVKQSFQFNIGTNYDDLLNLYGFTAHNGTTPTGIGDSFTEFSYFGCTLFALIGYLFKTLWVSTVYRGSLIGGLLYMSLISPAMVGITHGIGRFIQEFFFQAGTLLLVSYFCKKKS